MAENVYVLDACALIAFLNGEDGAEKVYQLFEEARSEQTYILMSVVNLCEVFYDCYRVKGIETALTLFEDIEKLPIRVCREIGDDLVIEAGKFKVEQSVSFADAFALGLAKLSGGKLVSTDHHEFDIVDQQGLVSFYWLR